MNTIHKCLGVHLDISKVVAITERDLVVKVHMQYLRYPIEFTFNYDVDYQLGQTWEKRDEAYLAFKKEVKELLNVWEQFKLKSDV